MRPARTFPLPAASLLPARTRTAVRAGWLTAVFLALLAGPALAGSLISARCPCGFTINRMPVFGGRGNYKTVCLFPALCLATGQIVRINVLAPANRPKDCSVGPVISYADPSLAPDHPGETLISWHISSKNMVLRLYQGGYYCPRCHHKTLRFSLAGFYD